MSRGLNKAMIIGHLGNDPEIRYAASGSAIANLSIATSESWRDRQSGEQQERTEWHRVVMFGKLAEIAEQYLKKGSQVFVEGRLQTRKWEDKSGMERYTTEIVANDMRMLGGRGGGQDNFDQTPRASSQKASGGGENKSGGGAFEDFDDDIPF